METNSLPEAIPGYRLIKEIGRGSSGVVWLAEEPLTFRMVAVKVLPKIGAGHRGSCQELDSIRQFQQVSRGCSDIVQILKFDETPDCFFYSMELADDATLHPSAQVAQANSRGTTPAHDISLNTYEPLTLKHVIDHEAPIDPIRALDMIEPILRALDHLHSKGLIHRDVKPGNILFVQGQPKLGDLGLVTPGDRDVTMIGTPGYLPPDARIDQTADLYAAGIVLYELISGLPRDRNPALPDQLPPSGAMRRRFFAAMRVANRSATRDRQERFDSAQAMLDYIRKTRTGELARRKWAIAGSVLIVVSLMIALIVTRIGSASIAGVSSPPTEAVRAVSAGKLSDVVDGGGPGVIRVGFSDGLLKTHSFPSPVLGAVAGEFWPGKSSVAVGFERRGTSAGMLMIFDALDFRTTTVPKPLYEDRHCNDPPAVWDFQEHSLICMVRPDAAVDLDGIPGDELVVTILHDDGPCEIIVMKSDGDKLGSFWHYGWLKVYHVVDLDGDGKVELLCAGVANWRESRSPYGWRAEPLRTCIMILSPESLLSKTGYWGPLDWMRHDSGVAPAAYGCAMSGQSRGESWAIDRCEVFSGAKGTTIRVWLNIFVFLDLNADLSPIRASYRGDHEAEGDPLPPVNEIWKRSWPPDADSAKDTPANGE